MRYSIIGLLVLGAVSACDPNEERQDNDAPAAVAQTSFDGANYADDAAKVAHGKRLADVLDCTGCHGADMRGKNVTRDDPSYGEMNAPNITLLLPQYSDDDLVKLLRQGIPKDGREFWFMPVESFQFLSDADMAALIAYLRTFKPAGEQLPPIVKGKGFYEDIERGFLNAQSQVKRYRELQPAGLGPQHERGRYIAKAVCTACHNGELQGYEGFSPNLDIAGAYTEAELEHLLTTGEGKVKKDLGMMSEMSRDIFSKMTPGERADLIRYLKARAERPQ